MYRVKMQNVFNHYHCSKCGRTINATNYVNFFMKHGMNCDGK